MADHQCELYVTMMTSGNNDDVGTKKANSRNKYHYDAARSGGKKNDVMLSVSRGGCGSRSRSNMMSGPVMHLHRTFGQVHDAAMTFANVILQRRKVVFSPPVVHST